MNRFLPGIAVVALAALVAPAGPASAQTFGPRPTRPEWGIFASGVSKAAQRLVLTVTFGGGYDDDLSKIAVTPIEPIEPDGRVTTNPVMSGPFGSASALMSYVVEKETVQGGLQFAVAGRNYQQMTDPFVGTYSASGNLNASFGERATLATSYFAGQYLQNLAPPGYNAGAGFGMPGVPSMPGDPGTFTSGDTYRGLGASANYSHSLTAKLAATAAYTYYANDSWSSTVNNNLYSSQYASAGINYTIARGLGVHAGYGSTIGGFGSTSGQTPYRMRSIDAGVDFSRTLSLTRRSTLSFGTGLRGIADQASQTYYYFVGNVSFSHEIGRTWSVGVGASRSADFYQTLGQPTVTNSVFGGLNGLIGRRVNVYSGLSAYQGAYVGAGSQAYVSASAVAAMQVALNRILAVGAVYSLYHYEFARDAIAPPGFRRQLDRQSVRVSLIVWAPLVTQARRANASR